MARMGGAGGLVAVEGLEEGDNGVEGLGRLRGVRNGEGFDAETHGAEIADAGDEGRVFGDGQAEAGEGDEAAFGEGKADLADGPGAGEGGHLAVEAGEEGGAAEGVEGGAMAVEHGVDLLGGGRVAGSEGVGAELGKAEGARVLRVADGDGEDGVAGVGFAGGGDAVQVAAEAGGVEAAGEDLGVGDGTVGAGGVGHAVEGEGGGVEVALGHDAGGVDELLEVGGAGDGGAVEVGGGAERLEVGVDDGVALGEEPGGQGWGGDAEVEGRAQEGYEQGDRQDGVAAGFTHGWWGSSCCPA